MDISVLGVDLGKNVCSVVGLDASGAVVMRRKVRRETLIALAEKLPPCIVGMEACCGAHHLGRVFAAHGHDVRLMSPEYVRPYIKAQKNDDRDAKGIAEAVTRPTMRFVELKSQDQLDIQTLHRSRDRLVGERTALINQLRAILLERGMVAPQGKRKLEQFLSERDLDWLNRRGIHKGWRVKFNVLAGLEASKHGASLFFGSAGAGRCGGRGGPVLPVGGYDLHGQRVERGEMVAAPSCDGKSGGAENGRSSALRCGAGEGLAHRPHR